MPITQTRLDPMDQGSLTSSELTQRLAADQACLNPIRHELLHTPLVVRQLYGCSTDILDRALELYRYLLSELPTVGESFSTEEVLARMPARLYVSLIPRSTDDPRADENTIEELLHLLEDSLVWDEGASQYEMQLLLRRLEAIDPPLSTFNETVGRWSLARTSQSVSRVEGSGRAPRAHTYSWAPLQREYLTAFLAASGWNELEAIQQELEDILDYISYTLLAPLDAIRDWIAKELGRRRTSVAYILDGLSYYRDRDSFLAPKRPIAESRPARNDVDVPLGIRIQSELNIINAQIEKNRADMARHKDKDQNERAEDVKTNEKGVQGPKQKRTRTRKQRYPWDEASTRLLRDFVIVRKSTSPLNKMSWDREALDVVFPGWETRPVQDKYSKLSTGGSESAQMEILAITAGWERLRKLDETAKLLSEDTPIPYMIAYLRASNYGEILTTTLGSTRKSGGSITLPKNPRYLSIQATLSSKKGAFSKVRSWTVKIPFCSPAIDSVSAAEDEIAFAQAEVMMLLATSCDRNAENAYIQSRRTPAITSQVIGHLLSEEVFSQSRRGSKLNRQYYVYPIPKRLRQTTFGHAFHDQAETYIHDLLNNLDEETDASEEHPMSGGALAVIADMVSEGTIRLKFDDSGRKEIDRDVKAQLRLKSFVTDPPATPLARSGNDSSKMEARIVPQRPRHSANGVESHLLVCCLQQDAGTSLIDCPDCVNHFADICISGMNPVDQVAARNLLHRVRSTQHYGLPRADIEHTANALVDTLVACQVPPLFWTGYGKNAPVLVSAMHLRHWTVRTRCKETEVSQLVFPRQWIDIDGNLVRRIYVDALQSILGCVWRSPGNNLLYLLKQTRKVFDRQEIFVLVEDLRQEGKLSLKWTETGSSVTKGLNSLPNDDLAQIALIVNSKPPGVWLTNMEDVHVDHSDNDSNLDYD